MTNMKHDQRGVHSVSMESRVEEVGLEAGRQAMECDDRHRRNSTVSVLFVSGVPWVSPAVLPTTLVSARTHPLVRQDKTVYMILKNA